MAKGALRALVGLMIVVAFVPAARTQQVIGVNPTSPFVQVTLRQQLEKGLKCRRPVEFQFVDHVVKLVDKGELPLDIVNISYDWSRKRNSFRPFVYFQQCLVFLANKRGIDIHAQPLPN